MKPILQRISEQEAYHPAKLRESSKYSLFLEAEAALSIFNRPSSIRAHTKGKGVRYLRAEKCQYTDKEGNVIECAKIKEGQEHNYMIFMRGLLDFAETPNGILETLCDSLKSLEMPEQMLQWHKEKEVRLDSGTEYVLKTEINSNADNWLYQQQRSKSIILDNLAPEIARFKDMLQKEPYCHDETLASINWTNFEKQKFTEMLQAKGIQEHIPCNTPSFFAKRKSSGAQMGI